jgi:hypothetical protein
MASDDKQATDETYPKRNALKKMLNAYTSWFVFIKFTHDANKWREK